MQSQDYEWGSSDSTEDYREFIPPGVQVYDSPPHGMIPSSVYNQATDCYNGHCYTRNDCYVDRPRNRSYRKKKSYNCADSITFDAVIGLVSNVISNSGVSGSTRVWFQRQKSVVTMQVEGFTAQIDANGVGTVTIGVSINNFPATPVYTPIRVKLRGSYYTGLVIVDQSAANKYVIQFSLDDSVSGSSGDMLQVYGFTCNWIMDTY